MHDPSGLVIQEQLNELENRLFVQDFKHSYIVTGLTRTGLCEIHISTDGWGICASSHCTKELRQHITLCPSNTQQQTFDVSGVLVLLDLIT